MSHNKTPTFSHHREQLGGSFKAKKKKAALVEFNREKAEKKARREREKKSRAEVDAEADAFQW